MESVRCLAKVRYNHPGTAATVLPGQDGTARVILDEPARAVAPGQACVLYQEDLVLGGGWIWRVPSATASSEVARDAESTLSMNG